MKHRYYIYQKEDPKNNKFLPIVSPTELSAQTRTKSKYVGKKAQIQAILKFNNTNLEGKSKAEVNEYIRDNIFGTSKWNEYHNIFEQVRSEVEVVTEKPNLLCYFDVELGSRAETKEGSYIPITPEDEIAIQFVTHEFLGQPLKEYKGILNPIIKTTKHRL